MATIEVKEPRGLLWAPSQRLIAWSGRSLHFIDVGVISRVTSRSLFDTPTDDGPRGGDRLRAWSSGQFPLGREGARVWGALINDVLVVPEGHEAEADELLGWAKRI